MIGDRFCAEAFASSGNRGRVGRVAQHRRIVGAGDGEGHVLRARVRRAVIDLDHVGDGQALAFAQEVEVGRRRIVGVADVDRAAGRGRARQLNAPPAVSAAAPAGNVKAPPLSRTVGLPTTLAVSVSPTSRSLTEKLPVIGARFCAEALRQLRQPRPGWSCRSAPAHRWCR